MKKISKKVLSIVLVLAVLVGTGNMVMQISASLIKTVDVKEYDYPRSTDEPNYQTEPQAFSEFCNTYNYKHGFWQLANGWHLDACPPALQYRFSLIVDNNSGKALYCIEPGVDADQANNAVFDEEDYWSKVYKNELGFGHNKLPVDVSRRLYGLVLSYGYSDVLSTRWSVYNDADVAKLASALVTQILVWEITIGERDANFNWIAPPAGCTKISQLINISSNNLNDKAKQEYARIVSQVKNALSGNINYLNYDIPSFSSRDTAAIPMYDLSYEADSYTVTLTDENNVLKDCDIRCSNSSVRFQKNGNKLTVFVEAESDETATVTLTRKGVADYPGSFHIVSDNRHSQDINENKQDMIYLASTSSNRITIETTSFFKLNLAHTHHYVPWIEDPTCIHRGYTLWVCRCGDSYVNNYTDPLGHDFGPIAVKNPSCVNQGTTDYICSRCGAHYLTTQDATGHSESVWIVTTEPTCTTKGEKTGFCSTCGMALETESIPALGHGETVWKIDYDATADHNGRKTPYCSVCGEAVGKSVEFTLHTHQPGAVKILRSATCSKDGEQGTFCLTCGACYKIDTLDRLGHDKTAELTTISATCTTDGEKTTYCTRCGTAVAAKTIKAKGHSEGIWYVSSKATCTADGRKVCTCSECGEGYQSEVIPAYGHDEGTWKTSIPVTCTENGEEKRICTRCDAVIETRVIPALSHDKGVWSVTLHPSCGKAGEKTLKCTRCGEKIQTEPIAALVHDIGVWKVDYEATPDHNGQMSRYCTKCNQVLDTKPFTLHEHTEGYREPYLDPTCTTDGEGGIYCAICNVMFDTYVIPYLGHTYYCWSTNNNGTHSRTCCRCHELQTHNCSFVSVITPPTCTTDGYTTHTCSICAYTYVDTYAPALGHNFGEWHPYKDCDCVHGRECLKCGETETAEHQWSDWRYNEDGDVFKNGTKSRICPDCGLIQTETAKHTSDFGSPFYKLGLFVFNILHKFFYAFSLNWLFPGRTIKPKI